MFNLIKKWLLIKEIKSKEGIVHFRRYCLLSTYWFNVYIHQILKSDEDNHFHDHPFDFISLILKGSYEEFYSKAPHHLTVFCKKYLPVQVARHQAEDAHKLTLLTPEVWTLVFTSKRKRTWGYHTQYGWIDFQNYRELKNEGKLK